VQGDRGKMRDFKPARVPEKLFVISERKEGVQLGASRILRQEEAGGTLSSWAIKEQRSNDGCWVKGNRNASPFGLPR